MLLSASVDGSPFSDAALFPPAAIRPLGMDGRNPLQESVAAIADPLVDLETLIAARKADDVHRLFALEQLEVTWDEPLATVWAFMRARGRPSYNLDLLNDIHALQRGIVAKFEKRPSELRYLVAGSRTPGVFSLGGDLKLFASCIRDQNRQALLDYGKSCVRVLHRFFYALGLPIVTIGLAQGDALGGGFESLLSFNVIIAERNAKFGFPENLFGLFPGMGAYSLLARRLGTSVAEEMILSGRTYTAEEMKDAGLVHILVEPGEGVAAACDYISKSSRRHNGSRAMFEAGRAVYPLMLTELDRVVEIWADACLQVCDRDLKLMQRLVSAQNRLQPLLEAAE